MAKPKRGESGYVYTDKDLGSSAPSYTPAKPPKAPKGQPGYGKSSGSVNRGKRPGGK